MFSEPMFDTESVTRNFKVEGSRRDPEVWKKKMLGADGRVAFQHEPGSGIGQSLDFSCRTNNIRDGRLDSRIK